MTHTDDHDPILAYRRCHVCYQVLTAAWVQLVGDSRASILPVAQMVPVLRRMLVEVLEDAS